MKKLICSVIIVLLTSSFCYGKNMVKCQGELASKPTKDGFGRITLVCDGDIIINKDKPLYMYAKESLIVFDQTDIQWPDNGVKTIVPSDYKKKLNK